MSAPASPARVTVAICTWNRCVLLRQTLSGLSQLILPQEFTWEVLVVNNNCTDATNAVVDEFTGRLPLRLVSEAVPGLSNARNRAIAECRSEYLVFTDDDVQVSEGWLTAFVAATVAYWEAAVFGGPVEPWFPVEPSPEMVAAFPAIRNGFCGIDHRRPIGPLPPRARLTGANMAFRLSALGTLRFDPTLGVNGDSLGGGEEVAFIAALIARGDEVIWVPEMRLKHYVDPARMTTGYLIRLARDRGRSSIRRKGIPDGFKVAGAPVWMWSRCAGALASAATAYALMRPVRAAGHFAKFEAYRAEISECWAIARSGGHRSSSQSAYRTVRDKSRMS